MANKRLRAEFESDHDAHQCPFVLYGTPLPRLDSGVQDDGSYVPLWKQEVKDERGRKRLHGAFTGGFSAGYFNTVGSKEGWSPSSFISSRSNRRKEETTTENERRAQFMDEEDLADAEEAQALYTSINFEAIGTTAHESGNLNPGHDFSQGDEDAVGVRLLRTMGWKGMEVTGTAPHGSTRPHDINIRYAATLPAFGRVSMGPSTRQSPSKGLGFQSNARLTKLSTPVVDKDDRTLVSQLSTPKEGSKSKYHSGQTKEGSKRVIEKIVGSDDDSDTMGPKIQYNRRNAPNCKTKKKTLHDKRSTNLANPSTASRVIYQPAKPKARNLSPQSSMDGRPLLNGFCFNESLNEATIGPSGKCIPYLPIAPEGWTFPRSRQRTNSTDSKHTVELKRASKLNPGSRAELLGETALPGKSVFEFISSESRDRLAEVTGRDDLPQGLGEALDRSKAQDETQGILPPVLDKETALAALSRGIGGWLPYSENDSKRARYRAFMEFCAQLRPQMPPKPTDMTRDGFQQELREFSQAAAVFKPMTGMMASRFSSASSPLGLKASKQAATVPTRPEDPAEAAAKLGMFGPLTRHSFRFFPSRLVCKRFDITPPAHVQESSADGDNLRTSDQPETIESALDLTSNLSKVKEGGEISKTVREMLNRSYIMAEAHEAMSAIRATPLKSTGADPSHNAAIEAKKAGEALFQSVFGDESDHN